MGGGGCDIKDGMAVGTKSKVKRRRAKVTEPVEDYSWMTATPEVPKPKKSWMEKFGPVMVVAIVAMAFVLGSMWTKIKYLESGSGAGVRPPGAAAGQGTSKYKSLSDAWKDYAKQVGIDGGKLVACVDKDQKKAIVDADTAEGAGLGINGTPGFFVNGKFVAGAFPYEVFKELIDKELAGQGSSDPKDYSAAIQGYVAQGAISLVAKPVAADKAPTKGEGSVTVVEFSDFQCPYCARVYPTVTQLLKDYEGKIVLAYKHFPLAQIHPNAQKAAEASECAREQGKFWEFHDKLFENQADWSAAPQT